MQDLELWILKIYEIANFFDPNKINIYRDICFSLEKNILMKKYKFEKSRFYEKRYCNCIRREYSNEETMSFTSSDDIYECPKDLDKNYSHIYKCYNYGINDNDNDNYDSDDVIEFTEDITNEIPKNIPNPIIGMFISHCASSGSRDYIYVCSNCVGLHGTWCKKLLINIRKSISPKLLVFFQCLKHQNLKIPKPILLRIFIHLLFS